ncbi:MAG TPA: glycosyltransferase family 39 protein [Thermoanaerobaculia bacterium]|nr:glycosyltransferase family 39 protein [Thermoanaerobaculia bacterium]
MHRATPVAAALLLAALALQLHVHVTAASPTIDEPTHILAGYRHLRCGDFGINPEHPPLAKIVAALPLLTMNPRDPLGPCTSRAIVAQRAFQAGGFFLAGNGVDRVTIPARLAVATFTLLLALLVFLFARELFGDPAALVALAVFAFEPTLIAHGSLVTTDMPFAAMFFATVYAAYRYRNSPSVARLLVTAVAAGLTLSAKHTGVLVLPIVVLLLWRHLRACAAVLTIAVAVLFATYGFQFAPYFDGIRYIAEHAERQTWIFDRAYPRGQWFYFPLAFAVKASITALVLTVFAPRTKHRLLLLAAPALVLVVAMLSGINIGVRHVIAVWPFLLVAGAVTLVRWRAVTGVLLLFHVLSAVLTAPRYIAYANDFWGGPDRTYTIFKDSDAEWGQSTKLVRAYVEEHGITDCWFAAYGHGAISRALQPCTLLPALGWTATGTPVEPIPRVLRGTVFVSASVFPPRGAADYLPIITHPPEAILGGSVLVYRGAFEVPALVERVEHIRARQLATSAGASAPSPAPSAGSPPPARNAAAP